MSGGDNQVKRDELDELVLAALTDDERKLSAAYLDTRVRPKGKALLGKTEVGLEGPKFVAFIDQRPGANWSHPCRYLLLDPAARQVRSVEADTPPIHGILPMAWRLLWRSPGLDDWRLIPIQQQGPSSNPTLNEDTP
ncbi:MAG TPA: hypothetical protein VGF85_09775 [Opitutaceae bacterium]|jgi:hypothetical protein